jgi:uncharacterized protein YodC (DUF2158 family)
MRVPKFIPSDKVRLKEDRTTVMSILKFKYVVTDNEQKYTGLITCYWEENGEAKTEIFHEDRLELATSDENAQKEVTIRKDKR